MWLVTTPSKEIFIPSHAHLWWLTDKWLVKLARLFYHLERSCDVNFTWSWWVLHTDQTSKFPFSKQALAVNLYKIAKWWFAALALTSSSIYWWIVHNFFRCIIRELWPILDQASGTTATANLIRIGKILQHYSAQG